MSIQKTILKNNRLFVINSSTQEVLRELKPISITCQSDIWYYYNRIAQYLIKQNPRAIEYSKEKDIVYAYIDGQKYEYMKPVYPVEFQKREIEKERLAFQS